MTNDPLTVHRINPLNRDITITPEGEPGPGGAHFRYEIIVSGANGPFTIQVIEFQNGDPSKERNGITNETLLAILIHRLEGFQSGQFKNRDNAVALTHIETALLWLQKRTREREQRGVEGKQVP